MNSGCLQLDLFEDVENAPWNGRSPRALTRVGLGFILQPRGEKSTSDFVCGDQLSLFTRITPKKAPWLYEGAPLLQEF